MVPRPDAGCRQRRLFRRGERRGGAQTAPNGDEGTNPGNSLFDDRRDRRLIGRAEVDMEDAEDGPGYAQERCPDCSALIPGFAVHDEVSFRDRREEADEFEDGTDVQPAKGGGPDYGRRLNSKKTKLPLQVRVPHGFGWMAQGVVLAGCYDGFGGQRAENAVYWSIVEVLDV